MSDNKPDFSQGTPPYKGGNLSVGVGANTYQQTIQDGEVNIGSPFDRFTPITTPGSFVIKKGAQEIPALDVRERLTAKAPQVGGSEIKPKEDPERKEIEELGRAAKDAGINLVKKPDGTMSLKIPDGDYTESVNALQITISDLLSERRTLLGKYPTITRNTPLEDITKELEEIGKRTDLPVASIVEKIRAFEKLLRKESARIAQEEQEEIQRVQQEQRAEQEKLRKQQERLVALVPLIARFTALSERGTNLLNSKDHGITSPGRSAIDVWLYDLNWLHNNPGTATDHVDDITVHIDKLQALIQKKNRM